MKTQKICIETPLGNLEITGTETAITELHFAKRKKSDSKIGSQTFPVLKQMKKELEEYFAGKRTEFKTPLAPAGTPFQQQAWKALLKIPFGKTISYMDQAKSMKRAKAMRAVGSANGKNPLPIVIPCHRVIAKSGGLGGYSGGLDIKKKLLEIEGIRF